MKEILMYKQPAGNWKEALPLGNGRLGAMDFGGAWRETLQLDESTYWSGEASEENNRADSRELLAQIREALLEEDYERADELGHGLWEIRIITVRICLWGIFISIVSRKEDRKRNGRKRPERIRLRILSAGCT